MLDSDQHVCRTRSRAMLLELGKSLLVLASKTADMTKRTLCAIHTRAQRQPRSNMTSAVPVRRPGSAFSPVLKLASRLVELFSEPPRKDLLSLFAVHTVYVDGCSKVSAVRCFVVAHRSARREFASREHPD